MSLFRIFSNWRRCSTNSSTSHYFIVDFLYYYKYYFDHYV